jgi:hypothetical protein
MQQPTTPEKHRLAVLLTGPLLMVQALLAPLARRLARPVYKKFVADAAGRVKAEAFAAGGLPISAAVFGPMNCDGHMVLLLADGSLGQASRSGDVSPDGALSYTQTLELYDALENIGSEIESAAPDGWADLCVDWADAFAELATHLEAHPALSPREREQTAQGVRRAAAQAYALCPIARWTAAQNPEPELEEEAAAAEEAGFDINSAGGLRAWISSPERAAWLVQWTRAALDCESPLDVHIRLRSAAK